MSLLRRGAVVISESTRKLLGNLFELQDLGAKDLKGIAGPVRAWAALRAVESPAILLVAWLRLPCATAALRCVGWGMSTQRARVPSPIWETGDGSVVPRLRPYDLLRESKLLEPGRRETVTSNR
jgi:hypothetical protein